MRVDPGPDVAILNPRRLRLAWVVTWLLALVARLGDNDVLLVIAGLLLVALGAVYALDVQGAAGRPAEDGRGDSVVGWLNRPAAWRIGGALMAAVGLAWIALAVA